MSLASLSDIFDKLLADRKLAIGRNSRDSAEMLRGSLARKLVQYKTQMESVGYLDDDIAASVVFLEWKAPNTATYFLRPRKTTAVLYQILATADSATDDSNEQQQAA